MAGQKQGKKGKRQRAHKFTDPTIRARKNVKREMRKTTKKIEKLLRLREESRKRANCLTKVKDSEGNVIFEDNEKMIPKTKAFIRYQGMKKDSERHNGLKGHLQRLKNRSKELENEGKADTQKKSSV